MEMISTASQNPLLEAQIFISESFSETDPTLSIECNSDSFIGIGLSGPFQCDMKMKEMPG
jgi:hypothetical protein